MYDLRIDDVLLRYQLIISIVNAAQCNALHEQTPLQH
jgi:hypothetical protein